jgi:RNA polymerase sigma factor (sigma-70 family)
MTGKKRCPNFAEILRTTSPDLKLRHQVATCFYEELQRVARGRCRNETLAEDAAHDGLLKGLEALGTFRGDAPVEVWLKRLVASACNRLQRGRKNDPAFNLPLDDVGSKPADDDTRETGQEVALLVHERLVILREALTSVSEPNRTMFFLHEAQDVSLEELANRFSLTVEGVKARLKRTRMKLREELLVKAEEEV